VNADASLSSTTKSSVTSELQGGRSKMANRDFGAAKLTAKAAAELQSASAAAGLQDRANWMSAHVAWLASH
jgi:hypothetical protein